MAVLTDVECEKHLAFGFKWTRIDRIWEWVCMFCGATVGEFYDTREKALRLGSEHILRRHNTPDALAEPHITIQLPEKPEAIVIYGTNIEEARRCPHGLLWMSCGKCYG